MRRERRRASGSQFQLIDHLKEQAIVITVCGRQKPRDADTQSAAALREIDNYASGNHETRARRQTSKKRSTSRLGNNKVRNELQVANKPLFQLASGVADSTSKSLNSARSSVANGGKTPRSARSPRNVGDATPRAGKKPLAAAKSTTTLSANGVSPSKSPTPSANGGFAHSKRGSNKKKFANAANFAYCRFFSAKKPEIAQNQKTKTLRMTTAAQNQSATAATAAKRRKNRSKKRSPPNLTQQESLFDL